MRCGGGIERDLDLRKASLRIGSIGETAAKLPYSRYSAAVTVLLGFAPEP